MVAEKFGERHKTRQSMREKPEKAKINQKIQAKLWWDLGLFIKTHTKMTLRLGVSCNIPQHPMQVNKSGKDRDRHHQ